MRVVLDEHVPDPEERAFVEPRIAHLLGFVDAEHEKHDLFAAWRLFFEKLASTYPTLLAFEDLQWADESLLDFVEYLLDWSRDHPLFVVTLSRPELLERRPTWGAGRRNFTAMFLEPLPREAMEQLLSGLVPGLPPELRDRILERAEGIPLYAVETVRTLLDRGLLAQEGRATSRRAPSTPLRFPRRCTRSLLLASTACLSKSDGSCNTRPCLGKTFSRAALAALSNVEPESIDQLLASLARKEILGFQADPRSPERGQYGFLQDLVRHVAYETLSRHDRRARHLAAAEHLGWSEETIEVAAAHYVAAYEAAPDADDASVIKAHACDALVRAAKHAAALSAAAEARRYFEQAAQLVDESLERATLLLEAGEWAGRAGGVESATPLLEEALSLFAAAGDVHGGARASLALGRFQFFSGYREGAVARLEHALDVLETRGRAKTSPTSRRCCRGPIGSAVISSALSRGPSLRSTSPRRIATSGHSRTRFARRPRVSSATATSRRARRS